MEAILIIFLYISAPNANTAQVQTIRLKSMEECKTVEAAVKELIGGVSKTRCVEVEK